MKNYFCYKTIRELQYVFIYSFETVIKGYKNCIEMVVVSVKIMKKTSIYFN